MHTSKPRPLSINHGQGGKLYLSQAFADHYFLGVTPLAGPTYFHATQPEFARRTAIVLHQAQALSVQLGRPILLITREAQVEELPH